MPDAARLSRRVGLTGLVLAGGASRRMGADKALLIQGGVPLVVRAARLLAPICDRVLVASGPRPLGRGLEEIPDALPGVGPLGGLLAGLERASAPLVAVLAVDLPAADPAVLVRLAAAWDGEAAVVPVVQGRPQPLHAVWATEAAGQLRAYLERGGRRVQEAVTELGARLADEAVWGPADPGFARNLNRPGDLPGA